ncbi:superoxide dismutase [bacterium]|nr:superoxide dismutase [bacterium]
MDIQRRTFLQTLAALGVATILPSVAEAAAAPGFTVPDLGYGYNSLEPVIDTLTMQIHHDKHHAAYVKNLNDALAKTPGPWSNWTVEQLLQGLSELPMPLQLPVRNNGGGHYNHSLFWKLIGPPNTTNVASDLKGAIEDTFGSWQKFQDKFSEAAVTRFGSGWAWLVLEKSGSLAVTSTPNQDTPLLQGHTPLLGIDVWEHAYYLKYKNMRKDYVDQFWKVVNWEEVGRRWREARA